MPAKLSFHDFAECFTLRNAWVREPGGLSIYVRRSHPCCIDVMGDFQIANINAKIPGKGAYSRFLDKYEPRYSLYVENVLNERLIPFHIKRGYRCVDTLNQCFLRHKGPINAS